jgi:peptidoglycan hydrolase-like protein with peptidoglycan-binding domain
MSRSQIQYGSQGNDVKELQTLLNNNGYKLTADGIFGANTQKAVEAYQQKYGLTVDGIVGEKTWGQLLGGSSGNNTTTPTAPTAPKVEPLPTNPTYDSTKWGDTEQGKAALDAYNTAKDAVANHGDFKYGNQQQLDALINSILNRDKFSYDLNGDALYQQYKDKYIQQGKLAMGDAIGQASAMTGGYGNSYAQSVGQQAYQGQLDKLNDIVPQLYQMALDKYNAEGQEMYNQYGLLTDDYNREYGMYKDDYSRLLDALGIAKSDYYDGANLYHTEQNNKNNIASKEFEDAMSIWNANNTNAWNEAQWNRDQTWRDEDIKREQDRWAVEDAQWQKQFDAVYGNKNTGGSSGGSSSGGSYDNGGYSDSIVKQAQKFVGATEDGKWGPNSTAAAKAKGYNSLAEVVAALGGGGSDTKGWKDHNTDTLNTNQSEYGGSYYKSAKSDVDKMIASGKSYQDLMSYAQEMVGNSYLSKSEYMTLVQYIRNKMYN